MKRVLVVAYYFPPRGGAGTQRFAKFCKYLPEHGFSSTVLTSGAVAASDHAPYDDPSLVDDTSLAVERVDAPRRGRLRRRIARTLRFNLDEDEWADAAEQRAVELVKAHAPDVVVTTLSPFACYRIGQRLSRQFDLPWVLDLRDPWSLDGWRQYRSSLHAAHDLRHMRAALTGADFVIANVPEAAKAFVAMGSAAERTVVIPNGFDSSDFEEAPTAPGDGRFHLVHMGTFHAVDAPEGLTSNRLTVKRHRQVAPLGRTGYYLLHAIRLLAQRSPAAFARLRVDLYGHVDATHRQLIERLELGNSLVIHGYVPHRESVAALCAADAVFVPLHGVPADERALVVPGKLYEALASQRAILAALPPGDGADLVRALAGVVVPPTDSAQLSVALEQLIEADGRGEAIHGCCRERLEPFSRRHLTGLLAQVLEAAIRRDRTVGLADPWSVLAADGPGRSAAQESA